MTNTVKYLFMCFFLACISHESESCLVMSNSLQPHGQFSPWNYPNQNTGVGSLSLLQGIFPIQGSNLGLLHCKWILDQLSHKGSPRILEWVAYCLSSGSSRPRNWTGVSCITGRYFTNWAIRDVLPLLKCLFKYCFQLFGAVFVCFESSFCILSTVLYQIYDCEYLLPICTPNSISGAKVVHFDDSNLSICSFMDCAFSFVSKKSLSNPSSQKFSNFF